MSVPAAKALPPAPTITIARTDPSVGMVAQIAASRSYIAKVRALRASGRLNVTQRMPSRSSSISSGV